MYFVFQLKDFLRAHAIFACLSSCEWNVKIKPLVMWHARSYHQKNKKKSQVYTTRIFAERETYVFRAGVSVQVFLPDNCVRLQGHQIVLFLCPVATHNSIYSLGSAWLVESNPVQFPRLKTGSNWENSNVLVVSNAMLVWNPCLLLNCINKVKLKRNWLQYFYCLFNFLRFDIFTTFRSESN